MRTCTICGETKPESEFHRDGQQRRRQCWKCRTEINALYQQSEAGKIVKRRAKLKHLYGITPEEYDELLELQGGACGICRVAEPMVLAHFSVDHDHETGVVRGLLCLRCNNNLGWFERYRDQLATYLGK